MRRANAVGWRVGWRRGIYIGRIVLIAWALSSPCIAATVILQQGLNGYTNTADAWLNEDAGGRDNNYGGDTNLFIHYNSSDGGYIEDCAIVRFGLPVVTHDSIASASLALFFERAISFIDDNYMAIKPYRIHPTNSWFENTGRELDNQGVNWLYRDQHQSQPWGSSAGWAQKIDDGNGTNMVKSTGGLPAYAIEPGNWVTFVVSNSVAQWYSGQTNNGWVLFSSGFTGTGYSVAAQFASRDSSVTATRPKLTITYAGAHIPWTGLQNGDWNVSATNNWSVGGYAGTYGNGDHVTFNDGSTRTNISVGAGIAPASVTVSNDSRTFTFSGSAIGGAGGLTKLGGGTAVLLASNAFAGATVIAAGTLVIGANGALGGTAAGTTVSNGASIAFVNGTQFLETEPLNVRGAGAEGAGAIRSVNGSNTFAGPVTLAADTVVDAAAGSALALSGVVGGAGGLIKTGNGLVVLSGPSGNTYGGTTTVAAGTLALSKSAGIAIPGALTIGDGANAATVRVAAASQIAAGATVGVRSQGVLELQGFDHGFAGVTMSGGRVSSGAGTLTLNGDLAYDGTAQTATIDGRLSLGGTQRTIQVANGASTEDMAISAVVSDGAIRKTGAGRLVLQADNRYAGGTTIADGELVAGHSNAMGAGPVALGEAAAPAALYAAAGVSVSNPIVAVGGGIRVLGGIDTGAAAFHGPITLSNSVAFTCPSGGVVDLLGAISGVAGATLKKTGAGTVVLSASNSFEGPVEIDSGSLVARHPNALGTGATLRLGTMVGGGSATLALDGPITVTRDVLVQAQTTSTLAVSNAPTGATVTGGIDLQRPLTVNVAPDSLLRLTGTITGVDPTTGIAKMGGGTVEITEANSYVGATTIGRGLLLANNAKGSATGAGQVTVGANGILGGTGSVSQVLALPGGVIAPGLSIGTLSVSGNVTLLGALNIEVSGEGSGAVDVLRIGGALDITSATVSFFTLEELDDPAYVFATYATLVGSSFANVELLPPNYEIDYAYNGGTEIALVLIPEPGTALLLAFGALLFARRRRMTVE